MNFELYIPLHFVKYHYQFSDALFRSIQRKMRHVLTIVFDWGNGKETVAVRLRFYHRAVWASWEGDEALIAS